MRRLLHLLVPLALVLTACGGDDGHDMSSMNPSDTMPGAGHGGHMNSPVPDGARTIKVSATSFSFKPDTIEVDAKEPIAIELSAADTEHDFVIEELKLHVVAAPGGESATGGFTAPAPGEYHYFCSVAGHRAAGMEGTLVVS